MYLLIWKLYSDLGQLLVHTSCIVLAAAVIIKIIILAAEFDRAKFSLKPHFEHQSILKSKNINIYTIFYINIQYAHYITIQNKKIPNPRIK